MSSVLDAAVRARIQVVDAVEVAAVVAVEVAAIVLVTHRGGQIYAASLAGLEAFFLVGMGEQITGLKLAPVHVGVDNKGAVDMSHDFVSNARVRHYERRHLKIRELVEQGLVKVDHVRTDDNVSDIFTKALSRRLFEKHRKTLLNMY